MQGLFPVSDFLRNIAFRSSLGSGEKQYIILKRAAYFRRKLPRRVGNRAALGPGSAEDRPRAVVCNLWLLPSGCLELCDSLAGTGAALEAPWLATSVSFYLSSLGGVFSIPVNLGPFVSCFMADAFCGNVVPGRLESVFSIDSIFEQYTGVHCLPGKKDSSRTFRTVCSGRPVPAVPGRSLWCIFCPGQTTVCSLHKI